MDRIKALIKPILVLKNTFPNLWIRGIEITPNIIDRDRKMNSPSKNFAKRGPKYLIQKDNKR
jgi:hypothetical protein